MNLKSCIEFLQENGYVTMLKGKLVFTRKYSQETTIIAQLPVPVRGPERFMQFIIDAKVPKYISGTRGEVYPGNKYSKEADKIFNEMLDREKIDYNILVRSTMLYYASKSSFKKAIGNYITYGDWRTDYEALKNAANSGEQQLKEHIKSEVNNGGKHNPYTLG